MTSVGAVTGSPMIADISCNTSLDFEGALMLALIERISSLDGDLRAQADDIKSRNQLKKLFNEKLSELDRLMSQAENKRGDGGNVTIDVAADEFPYQEYEVSTGPDGTRTLVPTTMEADNEVTKDFQYRFSLNEPANPNVLNELLSKCRPNCEPGAPAYTYENGVFTTTNQDFAAYVAQYVNGSPPPATFVGYRLKVSPDALAKQAENLKTKIDGLNTDGELATLRLNDLMNKAQLSTQLASNLSEKLAKMRDAIVQNIRP
jgi:hypothetical protein